MVVILLSSFPGDYTEEDNLICSPCGLFELAVQPIVDLYACLLVLPEVKPERKREKRLAGPHISFLEQC